MTKLEELKAAYVAAYDAAAREAAWDAWGAAYDAWIAYDAELKKECIND